MAKEYVIDDPADDKPKMEFEGGPEGDEFEIVDELDEKEDGNGGNQPDPNKELLEKIQALEARSQKDAGSQDLAKQLTDLLSRQQPAQPANNNNNNPVNVQEELAKIKEMFYDDPIKAQEKYTQLQIAPAFQQMLNKVQGMAKRVSKQEVMLDPKYKEVMDKYGSEVEDLVKTYQNEDQPYLKAAKSVMAEHVDDLLEARIANMKEELLAELKGSSSKAPGHTDLTSTPSPARRKRQVVLTPEQKKMMELSPLPKDKYIERLIASGAVKYR